MRNPEVAKKNRLANKGKFRSDETKKKIGLAVKQHPKLKCEHCNLTMNKVNYFKWHGQKCRSKN